MWDNLSTQIESFNHAPGGCNVLYLDGHVEFVKYPSDRAPVTKDLAAILQLVNIRPEI
jgi:prepilin-type processing-associated H-X9-DG protein